jgi:hypothetical protein
MSIFKSGRQILLLAICAVGAIFIGAGVVSQTSGQPVGRTGKLAVDRPKVAVKKHTIEQDHLLVLNSQKPIEFKKFELAELQTKDGNKLTVDSVLTLPNKKTIKAGDLLASLNKTEAALNEYGYSVRKALPTGGVRFEMKNKTSDALFAKQRAHITSTYHEVTAEKDQLAKANLAMHTKANLPALLTTASANHDKVVKSRQEKMDQLKKVDPKTLTPAELKVYNSVIVKKNAVAPATAKLETHAVVAARMKNQALPTRTLIAGTKLVNPVFKDHLPWVAKHWEYDRVNPWNWVVGSPSTLEAHVNGSLEVHAYDDMFQNSLNTRGSFQVGCQMFDQQFPIFDVLAEISSSNSIAFSTLPASSSSHSHLHAKLFGSDLFSPIEVHGTQEWRILNKDFHWDQPMTEGPIVLLGIPLYYKVGIRGLVHINVAGFVTPTWISTAPSVDISATVYAFLAVDTGVALAGVRGTVNIIDEHLELQGKAAILIDGNPRLDIVFSAKDKLTLLGGKVEWFTQYLGPDLEYHDLLHDDVFSWPAWTPFNGYMFNDHVTIPLN